MCKYISIQKVNQHHRFTLYLDLFSLEVTFNKALHCLSIPNLTLNTCSLHIIWWISKFNPSETGAIDTFFIIMVLVFVLSLTGLNIRYTWALWALSFKCDILGFHKTGAKILTDTVRTGGELTSVIKLVFTGLFDAFLFPLLSLPPSNSSILTGQKTHENFPSMLLHRSSICVYFSYFSFFFFSFKTPVTSAIRRPFKELSRFLVCFRCLIPLLLCVREPERR